MSKVSTCLWFGKDGEAAARFYVSLVPDSSVTHIMRAPADWPGGKKGEVAADQFHARRPELSGAERRRGAKLRRMSPSSPSNAWTRREVDRLWEALTADGGAEIACGWLRDKWGVPWQIVPKILPELLANPAVAPSVFDAMTKMIKLDIAALQAAAKL